LQLSKLNFIDQVRLFYNCKQIIAPHGAGLTNLIFCKKNTRVLEIFPKNHNQTRVYKKISKINKLNYVSIKCDKTTFSKKGDMLTRYYVNQKIS
jgi:capsular polysaccharide biosynthesis protein